MSNQLRIHRYLARSRANGPGLRAVVWVQGCTLHCPGCFNPETHTSQGGEVVPVAELLKRITDEPGLEGVTVSGGEPLQQLNSLLSLLQGVRQTTSLTVLLFTGYSWEEVQRMPRADELLACVDVLIAGRYEDANRVARGLLGSANKTVHFLTKCYTMADLEAVPPAEVVITAAGEVVLSGIDPLHWEALGGK